MAESKNLVGEKLSAIDFTEGRRFMQNVIEKMNRQIEALEKKIANAEAAMTAALARKRRYAKRRKELLAKRRIAELTEWADYYSGY